MRKISILFVGLALCLIGLRAQETYRLEAVASAYTTPENGQLVVKTKDNLPRMADYQTKLVLRFDPFFFSAENEDVSSDQIISAEVVIVSVLEKGLTGTSRRINDGEIMVYECDNSWNYNAAEPSSPFEIGQAIAGPIYYPAIGANDGTEEFMRDYEEPTRIDITEFFKAKFVALEEFSLDFIKSSEYSTEFTRMGGHGQSSEEKRPRIEITYNNAGSGLAEIKEQGVRIWSEQGVLFASIENNKDAAYKIVSVVGKTVGEGVVRTSSQQLSGTRLPSGIYLVILQAGDQTINRKIIVK